MKTLDEVFADIDHRRKLNAFSRMVAGKWGWPKRVGRRGLEPEDYSFEAYAELRQEPLPKKRPEEPILESFQRKINNIAAREYRGVSIAFEELKDEFEEYEELPPSAYLGSDAQERFFFLLHGRIKIRKNPKLVRVIGAIENGCDDVVSISNATGIPQKSVYQLIRELRIPVAEVLKKMKSDGDI